MKKQQHDRPKKLTWREIETLIDTKLKGLVVLTGRARQSLKKADYQDPQLVWQAVELLATHYKRMRKGLISKEEFRLKCRELNLQYEWTHTKGDRYNVNYRGKPRHFDFHLKKGSDREPRNCLRIYFFYDEDNELVVIGHLPSHLDNSKT